MSEDNQVEAQILRIQDKLQQLLRQRDLLLKENGKLRDELHKIQEGQAEEGKRLEQLRQQVEVLRVTKTVMSEGEKKGIGETAGSVHPGNRPVYCLVRGVSRSNSFDEPQFHFILAPEDLEGIDTIRQIVEAIPIQLLLVFLDLGLECAANDPGVISKNGA
jgi:hypothetical protein